MFDIGFAELMLIGVVGLLVIGPERLPGAIRTTSVWINRFRRGFENIKADVQRELHNDAVLRDLKENAEQVQRDLSEAAEPLRKPIEQARDELRAGQQSLQETLAQEESDINKPATESEATEKSSIPNE